MDNPLRFSDPDGNGPIDEVLFAAKHPIIAYKIGLQKTYGNNISSISGRIATNVDPNRSNEIRHFLAGENILKFWKGDC